MSLPVHFSQKKRIYQLGFCFLFFCILVFLAFWSEEQNRATQPEITQALALTRPQWMPASWEKEFIQQLELEKAARLFEKGPRAVHDHLRNNPWLEEVDFIRWNYLQAPKISYRLNEPLCLLKKEGDRYTYLNSKAEEMPMALTVDRGGAEILDENNEKIQLPLIDTEGIWKAPDEYTPWVKECLVFVEQWKNQSEVAKRLKLITLEPALYDEPGKRSYRLYLLVLDTQNNQRTRIKWGFNEDFSAIEHKSASEKWSKLKMLSGDQAVAFRGLDLSI